MTYEISAGGLSAVMTTPLEIGETVHLSPIVGNESKQLCGAGKGLCTDSNS
jgi:hypothetical protein